MVVTRYHRIEPLRQSTDDLEHDIEISNPTAQTYSTSSNETYKVSIKANRTVQ